MDTISEYGVVRAEAVPFQQGNWFGVMPEVAAHVRFSFGDLHDRVADRDGWESLFDLDQVRELNKVLAKMKGGWCHLQATLECAEKINFRLDFMVR